MTVRELIEALREDAEWAEANEWETPITLGDNLTAAADSLEALLAENERLKAGKDRNVPTKWVSVEERLPKHDEEVLVLTAPGTLSVGQNQVVAEYIHPINEKFGVFINFYAGYDDKNLLSVTHWQPLPEPPSTEGVE